MNDVMNYKDLSKYLKMAVGTLRHWVADGKIPYSRYGRNVWFVKKDIDEWLHKHQQKAKGNVTVNIKSKLDNYLFSETEADNE